MATIGEFSSLLQLGVGIGIGLSVFRAPVDLRVSRLSSALDDELRVLAGIKSDVARQRLGALSAIKIELGRRRAPIERWLSIFLTATVIGAVLNLAALVFASIDAQRTLDLTEQWGLITISVLYYLAILAMLEVFARYWLGDIERDFVAAGAPA